MKRINTSTFESGQALVEYILLLMIVLLISVGLLYQFNRSVRSYVNIFFGEYVACLIASGQLPSLGSEDSTGCEKPSFSFSDTDLDPSSNSENSNSYGGNTEPNNVGSNTANNRTGRSIGSNSLNESGGGSRGISSGGESGRVPVSDSSDGAIDNSSLESYGRESRVLVNDGSQAASDSVKSPGRIRNIPVSSIDLSKEEQSKLQANQMMGQDQIGKIRLVPIADSSGNKIDGSQTETGLDLSGFIKWLFIIGILIAILVLLFMQAVQIKKGLEK